MVAVTEPGRSRNMWAISARVLKKSVSVSNRKRFSSAFLAPVLMQSRTSWAWQSSCRR